MKPRLWILLLLTVLTATRIWCLGRIELSPDEAYHVLWAQHPGWCYIDKGPAVAMAIRAGTEWFGANEFGVCFFSPLLALGTSLAMFLLARKLYGDTVVAWAVAALNVMPVFQSGSVTMTPGSISIFFWSAAMLAFWLALEREPAFSFFWPVAGLLFGAAFSNDYSGAVAIASAALIPAVTGKYRRAFARPGFWIMLVCFCPFVIPAWRWNARHEWITLLAWRGRFGAEGMQPLAALVFLRDFVFACSPLMVAAMLVAVAGTGIKKARTHFKPRFLLLFSAPLFGLLFLCSLGGPVAMESAGPVLIGIVILSAALWHEAGRTSKLRASLAILVLCAGLGTSAWNTFDAMAERKTDAAEGAFDRWKSVATAVDGLRKKVEHDSGKKNFLIGGDDRLASILSFYLPEKRVEGPGHPPVYIPESQMIESEFSYWPRYDENIALTPGGPQPDAYYTEEQGVNPFMGRDALFISDDDSGEAPDAISNCFERVDPLASWTLVRNGGSVRRIRVFACHNYRSLPL